MPTVGRFAPCYLPLHSTRAPTLILRARARAPACAVHRQLHVIEVNIAPDLTLSTEGACAATQQGCAGGSSGYDHTKRAAAYSSIHLLFSSLAAAPALHALLARHGPSLPARFPSLHRRVCASRAATAAAGAGAAAGVGLAAAAGAPNGTEGGTFELRPFVLEYLLDAVREARARGCYLPVYPSAVHAARFLRHIGLIGRNGRREPRPPPLGAAAAASAQPPSEAERVACLRRDGCGDEGEEGAAGGDADSGWCGFDPTSRVEMHGLLELVLHDQGGAAWQEPYKVQCERMLREVPHVPQGAWARRTHVFREVPDVPL